MPFNKKDSYKLSQAHAFQFRSRGKPERANRILLHVFLMNLRKLEHWWAHYIHSHMLADSVIVKTNYYGDFRRFTVDKEIEYPSFVTVLQDLYDDKSLSPPSTHSMKYVDEEGAFDFFLIVCWFFLGDSITVVTTNDLKLAISYSRTLSRPILRLNIERKTTQSSSQTSSQNLLSTTATTENQLSTTSTPFPTLKIQGRTVQPPTGTYLLNCYCFFYWTIRN